MNMHTPRLDTLRTELLRPAQLDALVDLAERFFRESRVSEIARFDREAFRKRHQQVLDALRPDVCITLLDGQQVIGFALVLFENWWTIEPVAHLRAIYVVPEHRKGNGGRVLLLAALLAASSSDAVMLTAAPDAGLPSDKTLLNLLRRYDFEIGPGTAVKVLK